MRVADENTLEIENPLQIRTAGETLLSVIKKIKRAASKFIASKYKTTHQIKIQASPSTSVDCGVKSWVSNCSTVFLIVNLSGETKKQISRSRIKTITHIKISTHPFRTTVIILYDCVVV